MNVDEIIDLIYEVGDSYRTLQAIIPHHELLNCASLNGEGLVSFSNRETAERFKKRFAPEMSISTWDGSSDEYKNKLCLVVLTNYLSTLRRTIDEFVCSD